MSKKNKNGFVEFLAGKGFYIILILCVAAIGVSGYMLFFSGGGEEDDLALSYLDDPINSAEDTNFDRITMPTLPGTTPKIEPTPAQDDVPAAAVTTIPRPDPTPKQSPAPSTAPLLSISPPPSPTPAPEVSPSPSTSPVSSGGLPGVFVWPVYGETVNAFSEEDFIYNKTMGDWRVHMGIDIECALGTQVAAVADGVVRDVYDDVFLGTTVVVEHSGGLVSYYSNLMKKPNVVLDEKVTAGQVIGGVGQTAEGERREVNHLHFEMRLDGILVDPLDYLP